VLSPLTSVARLAGLDLTLLLLLGGCAGQGHKSGEAAYDPLLGDQSPRPASAAADAEGAAAAQARGDAALAQGDRDLALVEYLRALRAGGEKAEVLNRIGAPNLLLVFIYWT